MMKEGAGVGAIHYQHTHTQVIPSKEESNESNANKDEERKKEC
jgi:hypothetical protein